MADEGTADDRVLTTQEALNRIKGIVADIQTGQGGDSADIAAIRAAVDSIKANSDLSQPDTAAIKAAVDTIKARMDTITPEIADILGELFIIQANTSPRCDSDDLGSLRVEGTLLNPGDEVYIMFPQGAQQYAHKITDVRALVLLDDLTDGDYYKVRAELQILDPFGIVQAVDQGLIIATADSGGGGGGSPMVNGQPGIELKIFEAPIRDTSTTPKRPKIWFKNIGPDIAYITTIAGFNTRCLMEVIA